MVWSLKETKSGPGIIRPLLADDLESAIATVFGELKGFYSRFTSDKNAGLEFKRAERSVNSSNVKSWAWHNRVVKKGDGSLYAKVNVQCLGSAVDEVPWPPRFQQGFYIYFNVINKDKEEAERLSFQERDSFLEYLPKRR